MPGAWPARAGNRARLTPSLRCLWMTSSAWPGARYGQFCAFVTACRIRPNGGSWRVCQRAQTTLCDRRGLGCAGESTAANLAVMHLVTASTASVLQRQPARSTRLHGRPRTRRLTRRTNPTGSAALRRCCRAPGNCPIFGLAGLVSPIPSGPAGKAPGPFRERAEVWRSGACGSLPGGTFALRASRSARIGQVLIGHEGGRSGGVMDQLASLHPVPEALPRGKAHAPGLHAAVLRDELERVRDADLQE
jgi:hypothetical protein